MSSGDFEAQLRQSVNDHIALIHTAAAAAKARIGQTTSVAAPPEAPQFSDEPMFRDDASFDARPVPAVNFFAEEPLEPEAAAVDDDAFASALQGPVDPLPDGAIAFDDYDMQNVDDEGIPVWEDPT